MKKSPFLLACGLAAMIFASAPLRAKEPPAAEQPRPEMQFGSWGVDMSQLDPAIDPGNDFFAHVNARWIAANPIPPEHGRYGAFTMLSEKSLADIRALVDELVANRQDYAAGSVEARIVDSYQAYLNQRAINKAGLKPARAYLDAIRAADNLGTLSELFGRPGFPSPLGAWVMVDSQQPDRYITGIGAGGLGLPDRDYYLKTDDKSVAIQEKYRTYLAFLLEKAAYADPNAAAQAVYDLEYRFAQLDWDRTMSRNRDLTYNKLSAEQLDELSGAFPLAKMLEPAGLGDVGQFVAWQLPPDDKKAAKLGLSAADRAKIGGGLPVMFEVLSETPPAVLQAWMIAHFLSSNADVLPYDIDRADFEFFGKVLKGKEAQRPRWKRAIGNVQSQLGEVLGEAYVARHFPPASKAAMLDLVANLKAALTESLSENKWMGVATKAEAMTKLGQFTTKIGYPGSFETYDGLDIRAGQPLANAMAAARWSWQDELSKLNGPIDRDEWYMLPQTVNAYYAPSKNEIVFPAAILQPPFFSPDADPAVNYGAIGAVIGHEIGHGFDDQGAKSDGTGLMRDWWSKSDLVAFTALGDRLARQYDALCPLDDGKTCVNGRFTLGENIGDLGGLSLAYRAYHMSLDGQDAPVIDGLSGDQRFFLAWAQVWRAANREDTLRQRLVTDPHSPEQYRVNGVVRNMDEWYTAFGVTPADALFLSPEQRVRIW